MDFKKSLLNGTILSVLLSGTYYSQPALANDPVPIHESLLNETADLFANNSGNTGNTGNTGNSGNLVNPVQFTGEPIPFSAGNNGSTIQDVIAGDTPLFTIGGDITFNEPVSLRIDGGISNFITASAGQEYTLLQATGTLTYPEDYLEVLTDSPLLDITVFAEDNALKIRVNAKNIGDVISESGASQDAQAVINTFQEDVITNLDESDPLYQLFAEASNSSQKLTELAEDLAPEDSNSATVTASAAQSATFDSVAARTNSVRTGANTGDMFQSGGFWAQALHSEGNQENRSTSDGFVSRITGLTIGADAELNTHWTAGIALTTAKGTTNVKGSSNNTDSDSVIGTLYTSWQSGHWFADAMASFGRTKNEAERLNQVIKADYDANQYGLRLTAGKDFLLNTMDVTIQPTVSFNYGRVDIEEYKESGSQAAMEIKAQRYETIELGAGVTAIKSFEMSRGVLDASLQLQGWHDFAADQAKTQGRFITGDSIITSTGGKPERTTWQAGVALDYQANNNLTLSVSYDHSWKKTFKADTVRAKVRYDF